MGYMAYCSIPLEMTISRTWSDAAKAYVDGSIAPHNLKPQLERTDWLDQAHSPENLLIAPLWLLIWDSTKGVVPGRRVHANV